MTIRTLRYFWGAMGCFVLLLALAELGPGFARPRDEGGQWVALVLLLLIAMVASLFNRQARENFWEGKRGALPTPLGGFLAYVALLIGSIYSKDPPWLGQFLDLMGGATMMFSLAAVWSEMWKPADRVAVPPPGDPATGAGTRT